MQQVEKEAKEKIDSAKRHFYVLKQKLNIDAQRTISHSTWYSAPKAANHFTDHRVAFSIFRMILPFHSFSILFVRSFSPFLESR